MKDPAIQKAITDLRTLRQTIRELYEDCSGQQITMIPNGFSNNLFWHLGHVITVFSSLLYHRCHQPMPVEEAYLGYFGKGTSPSDFDNNIPLTQRLLSELFTVIDQTETDLPLMLDKKYDVPLTVSFGHTIDSFRSALLALPMHDAYHLGAMKLLRKFI